MKTRERVKKARAFAKPFRMNYAPADNNWFSPHVVAGAVIDGLASQGLEFRKASP